MKRLFSFLIMIIWMCFFVNFHSYGKDINEEFYKFKKILIPLSKEGSWKLIGKKSQSIYSAQLTWKYLAQTKDGQLSKLIELFHISAAKESVSESVAWFKAFAYQNNGFNSCIPQNSTAESTTLREKYYVYEESEKSGRGCFFTRNIDIEKEILYPSIKRKTLYLDTNHFSRIVKKYINNETKFPKIMLRSDHYFSSQKELYGYFEMINPDVNGAPNTLFKSEKQSEYHTLNIDNHPQKKHFYLSWIQGQAQKHSQFETELKRKNKIDLAKYINYELNKALKDNSEVTQTVKKDSETNNKKEAKTTKLEPTLKLEKKKIIKVVKVEENTQEEFKPKKTDQDNEAPVIKIAEAITVNDASYEIEGSVTDKSDKIFVQINGRNVTVTNGKFKMKRFSPVDEEIQIIATDQWGNTSKPKLVSVIIDQKDNDIATVLETLNPSKIQSKSNKNKVALIIGIEKYDQTPEASYANLDAKYFYEYAKKGFGISKSNIKLLVDEDANLIKSLGTLNKWLPGKIKSGETELIIFFAGHGLASNDGKELYLLPQDSDPDLLARTALSRTELFKQIISLNPKNVTIFLDTCYSGVSRDEKTLLASARPVRIVADEQDTPDNFTIFSASQLDQISSGFKEAKHGIFSYYLMKGLEGKADANKDKDITNGELLAYMDQNVAQKASELGRQQNPSLAGDPDKILMSYR